MPGTALTVERVPDLLQEVEDAFFDIPFENSAFQIRSFVIAAQHTPARAYRAIGLNMLTKINGLREHLRREQLRQVDIDEQEYIMRNSDDQFERRRAAIKLEELRDGETQSRKAVQDCLHDLNTYYAEFIKFPKFTREQFEAEEAAYFETSLKRQLQLAPAAEALENMRVDTVRLGQALAALGVDK